MAVPISLFQLLKLNINVSNLCDRPLGPLLVPLHLDDLIQTILTYL